MLRCDDSNCGYYYADKGSHYKYCHFDDDPWPAPCECDDDYEEE